MCRLSAILLQFRGTIRIEISDIKKKYLQTHAKRQEKIRFLFDHQNVCTLSQRSVPSLKSRKFFTLYHSIPYFNQPGKTVESTVPWKIKTLSPRRFEVGSILLLDACEFACEISVFTLTLFGKFMHIVAPTRPVDAQLYGTKNRNFRFSPARFLKI